MSRRQFYARVAPKTTLWEDRICPEDPERDFMLRLLRAEARDVQQEKAFQALVKALLGATVTVSDDEVSFWTPEGEPLRAPVLEQMLDRLIHRVLDGVLGLVGEEALCCLLSPLADPSLCCFTRPTGSPCAGGLSHPLSYEVISTAEGPLKPTHSHPASQNFTGRCRLLRG